MPAATPDQADPTSERILLHIDQPFPNHNGGDVAFGPDGDLYIAMGDGGSGGDPMGNGQNLDTLLGKILRIRPGASRRPPGRRTPIPADNPFAGRADARPEIFAYGLRNPWRFSFDRSTGDLWIGDVGQGAWEEVDHWPAGPAYASGPDFGWNVMEGTPLLRRRYLRSGRSRPAGRRVRPRPGLRDRRWLRLAGPGRRRACGAATSSATRARAGSGASTPARADRRPTTLLDSGRSISSFGEDEAGRLYLTDLGSGELYRIVTANP